MKKQDKKAEVPLFSGDETNPSYPLYGWFALAL